MKQKWENVIQFRFYYLFSRFILIVFERERGIKTVKLSESTSSGGRARFLPSPAKKKKKARTSGNGEWNWPGICFVLFNYYTAIYVWTVFLNFRTSGLWIQNEKEKKRMVWFLFDFIFLALCSLLLVFVEFCSYFWREKKTSGTNTKRPSNVVLEWTPSVRGKEKQKNSDLLLSN